VACVPNLGDLLWKRFERMRGNKPRRLDVVFAPQLQEPVDTDGGAEDAS
jgi:hypothetical protein